MSETLLKIPGIMISSCFIREDVDVLIDEHPDKSDTLDGLHNCFLQYINKKYYITISQHSPI
jgi:hypothetical protein